LLSIVPYHKYGKVTVILRPLANIPPDGYTTVTISTETATKLSTVMIEHDVDSMALAIDHAADLAIGHENYQR